MLENVYMDIALENQNSYTFGDLFFRVQVLVTVYSEINHISFVQQLQLHGQNTLVIVDFSRG